jgi:hypothetical protein
LATICYNRAKKRILDGNISLSSDTLKVMLVTSTYTPNVDDDFVDAGGASDPLDAEIAVTGYTGGWSGSGRKTLASKTFTEDDTANEGYMDAADVTWVGLAAGATIVGAILIKEGVSDDTTSELIAYFDITDTATDGNDITLQWHATGLLGG